LERDWAKEGRVIGGVRFREENEKGSVDPCEVDIPSKKGVENRKDVISEEVPKGCEESRAEAVRPRARKLVHIAEGSADFVPGERSAEAVQERGGVRVQIG
jgi:hypothetical protein